MNNECPKCKEEGRYNGYLSCTYDKNSDCWYEHCCNEDCDHMLPHNRIRNMKVDNDRRKNASNS